VRPAIALLALAALCGGCRTAVPATPLPADDPRPDALVAAWQAHTASRHALRATARLAVDAPGAGERGDDLALRSKQRMWLSRPANLRVEVLGFLDTAVAVLVVDGERYALLESAARRFDEGPVYDGLLWDAARLDLSPEEAVLVILGTLALDPDWTRSEAWTIDDRVRVAFADASGRPRRILEFGAGGELLANTHLDVAGETAWEAEYGDYVALGDLTAAPFARRVALSSETGRAEITLRNVELNPTLPPDLFRLSAPEGG
jgi:hypothetical protein